MLPSFPNLNCLFFIGMICFSMGLGEMLSPRMSYSQNPTLIEEVNLQSKSNAIPQKLIESNTKFSFKLFQQLLKTESQKNLFISPFSIALALSMTYNGANGKTQQEMAQTLEIQELSLDDLNLANQTLTASLEDSPASVQLNISNSLWGNQTVSFNPEFLKRNQEFYHAKVTQLDFSNPQSVHQINNWVKAKTQQKIPQIIDQLSPNDILVLINAIYFKGKWTQPFNASQTQNQPFYLNNGTTRPIPFMNQQGTYDYLENDLFQAVSLPYGDERFSFYVLLPKKNLQEFQQNLNVKQWQEWTTQFASRPGKIQIPKFKTEYSVELRNILQSLGMKSAFAGADFSQMTQTPVAISAVKHKTFIEVNEEGTEAAATTAVVMTRTSISRPVTPFQMVVNRPFFCVIRDNRTGMILFMGSMVEPK